MKKPGIIGGIGPESSIEYYRLIIKRFRERTQSKDYPELVVNSVNMTEMLDYVMTGQEDKLVGFLLDRIKTLELAGVDFVVMASNTPHIVFDKLAKQTTMPLVSIVEETCKSVKNTGIKKVGLLGTRSTMTAGFYQRAATYSGVEMHIPTPDQQDYVHEKYMNELVFNNRLPETKNRLVKIVMEMKRRDQIEGLVLGGTELPLILGQDDFPNLRIFDTTKIHVESIVEKMLEDRR